jgi:uracil-DNA glycosylase family 4
MSHAKTKMTTNAPIRPIIRDIRNTLVYLKQSGCTGFDCNAASLKILNQLGAAVMLQRWIGKPWQTSVPTWASAPDAGCLIRGPISCLVKAARTPKLVFVGEGPGFDEDRCGRPFVGAAGQLLTKIIAAMHLTRETVYIANIVKCRPPEQPQPGARRDRQCLPFLKRQLAAIHPRVICALGSVAARTLLETETPISRLRGRFHACHGNALMPTFHPAYLLRNPERKRDVWEDVQQIMNAGIINVHAPFPP